MTSEGHGKNNPMLSASSMSPLLASEIASKDSLPVVYQSSGSHSLALERHFLVYLILPWHFAVVSRRRRVATLGSLPWIMEGTLQEELPPWVKPAGHGSSLQHMDSDLPCEFEACDPS